MQGFGAVTERKQPHEHATVVYLYSLSVVKIRVLSNIHDANAALEAKKGRTESGLMVAKIRPTDSAG